MFCLGGFCPGGFWQGGLCPGGFCLGGFCPRTSNFNSKMQYQFRILRKMPLFFSSIMIAEAVASVEGAENTSLFIACEAA